MISRYEVKQVAYFFGDNNLSFCLFSVSKILIDEKYITVFWQPNRSEYKIAFKVKKRHEILTELINQKFNR